MGPSVPSRWQDVAFGVVVGALLAAALLAAAWLVVRRPEGQPIQLLTPTPRTVTVYVTGAVLKPGVYSLPWGSRVQDALDLAGGPAPNADLGALNLARRLEDGEALRVPSQMPDEAAPPAETSPSSKTPGLLRVNLNTATVQELEALPGVGPVLAQRIVEYRETHGPFARVDDLIQVSGIGPALLEKLRPYVYVEGP